jgi:hypothetical protein
MPHTTGDAILSFAVGKNKDFTHLEEEPSRTVW